MRVRMFRTALLESLSDLHFCGLWYRCEKLSCTNAFMRQ